MLFENSKLVYPSLPPVPYFIAAFGVESVMFFKNRVVCGFIGLLGLPPQEAVAFQNQEA